MGTNRDKQSKARMEVFESSSRERLTAVARAREGERERERMSGTELGNARCTRGA